MSEKLRFARNFGILLWENRSNTALWAIVGYCGLLWPRIQTYRVGMEDTVRLCSKLTVRGEYGDNGENSENSGRGTTPPPTRLVTHPLTPTYSVYSISGGESRALFRVQISVIQVNAGHLRSAKSAFIKAIITSYSVLRK